MTKITGMSINKKIFWFFLFAVPVVLPGVSCKKFLDRKPLQSTLDDLAQGKLESQILGMYYTLREFGGFSTLPWIDFHSIRDDDAQKGSDANDGREVNTEFETFQYNKDDWAINTYWNDHYTMSNKANEALYTADSINAEETPAGRRNIGEACFFRAYTYFELVKTFGEVPLFNFPLRAPTDGLRDKTDVNTIYAFIDSNLEVAAAFLPMEDEEYGPEYEGRLTKGAANTLWAQTYLFRSEWAKVIEKCNLVVASQQYELEDDFSDIFRETKNGIIAAGKNGIESIWEMNAWTGQNAATNDAQYHGSAWGTCQQVRQNGAPIEWNLGWGWNTPTDKLESQWPDTDPRKRKTILYSGQHDGGAAQGGHGATVPAYTNPDGGGGLAQKFWSKKLYTGNDPQMRQFTGYFNSNGQAPWINHRILRYADVLLMLAEAANELDQLTVAEENLEKVRNRASGNLGPARTVLPLIPRTAGNKIAFRDAIKAERRWEFAMEGYRFYDLVRWGDAQAQLGSLGYTNRCRYYPIPQRAIDLTGGVLTQNPEWP
jgi:starch-binding outer membrane protein, SusD/RagB family